MPVDSFGIDDLFVFRTIKSLTTNPDNRWANTYEVRAVIAGDTGDLLTLAGKFIDFERALHYAAVKFIGFTVSTWEEDSVPYNPTTFITSALSTFGTRVTVGNGLPLSSCLSVARVPLNGRLGHIFYRGALVESDVEAPAGKAILSDPTQIADNVEVAVGSSGLEDNLGTSAATMQIVMVNKAGTQVRPVVGLIPVGVSQVPSDHAWYNRANPSP